MTNGPDILITVPCYTALLCFVINDSLVWDRGRPGRAGKARRVANGINQTSEGFVFVQSYRASNMLLAQLNGGPKPVLSGRN